MSDADTRSELELTPIAIGHELPWSTTIGELQVFLGDHPAEGGAWYQLGISLNAEGRYEEAAAALHCALTLCPFDLGIKCEFAFSLCGLGDLTEASVHLEEVIHRDPGNGWAYFHLATVRYRQGTFGEAAALWECAARCLTDPSDSIENLAMVYRRCGNGVLEQSCWKRLAAMQPDNPSAEHMLAAVGITPVPSRASDAYVVRLFDRFAPDFDNVLEILEYAVPDLTESWMRARHGDPAASLRVLDAGCGTGLCGERLRPWSREIVGVDLSPKMLARARQRGVYDRLVESELVAFLRECPDEFDVVVAGDVLCYFGDLRPFCVHCLAALRPGGQLGFSVERAEPGQHGFVIRSHGRYAHTRSHLESVLREASGLHLSASVLRLEAGAPVRGYWVEANKK